MNKEKIKKALRSKIVLSISIGAICFVLGANMFSNEANIQKLTNENENLKKDVEEREQRLLKQREELDDAQFWLDMTSKQKEETKKRIQKEDDEAHKRVDTPKKKSTEQKESINNDSSINNQNVNTENIKEDVTSVIESEIDNSVKDTTLNSIKVNENLGTESKEDVIVLVNLSWSVHNREENTRKMIKIYSDEIAKKLKTKLENGSEIAFFWKAEYTGLDIKESYVIKDDKLYNQ